MYLSIYEKLKTTIKRWILLGQVNEPTTVYRRHTNTTTDEGTHDRQGQFCLGDYHNFCNYFFYYMLPP